MVRFAFYFLTAHVFCAYALSLPSVESQALYRNFKKAQNGTYQGSSAYCYADSVSMLLKSDTGQNISPSFIEVLTGVGMGAFGFDEELYLSSTDPVSGIRAALQLLGFMAEEIRPESILKLPFAIGPLSNEKLPPDGRVMGDHFIYVFERWADGFLAHDPAGFPNLYVSFERFKMASDNIGYSQTLTWSNVKQIRNLASKNELMNYFATQYRTQSWKTIEDYALTSIETPALLYFTLPTCARRSLDYAAFFKAVLESDLSELFLNRSKLCGSFEGNLQSRLVKLAQNEKKIESLLITDR
ncbi:MAG: hypothetical protein HYS98_02020 [Deltaproteobacteria bacterium]|nr:hypothetical protein [Deltaproteobacteria bacterium]